MIVCHLKFEDWLWYIYEFTITANIWLFSQKELKTTLLKAITVEYKHFQKVFLEKIKKIIGLFLKRIKFSKKSF